MTGRAPDHPWARLLELLEPIHPQVLATARRLGRTADDGDDLYQEAIVRAVERLDGLRDESRFRSWFFAVLLSVHRSRYRRAFWRRFVPLESHEPELGELPSVAPAVDADAPFRVRRARTALASLPAVQREAVVLFDIDGYSLREVAELQSASLSAVKSRLTRGRERLRKFYERRGWAEGSANRRPALGPLSMKEGKTP